MEDGPQSVPGRLQQGHSSGTLSGLIRRAGELEQLERKLRKLLPTLPPQQCRLAGRQNGVLRLVVANGTVATQVRFHQRQLLKALSPDGGPPLKKLVVRVSPDTQPAQPPAQRPAIGLAQSAAQQLEELAASETDPQLQAALKRLSQRRLPERQHRS